ncbi:MAG: Eco57I restriction-modification methylase domain-containing protein [Pontibacterium sp.]
MANKHDEFFHDKWLGHVQTESDGLVVAKPVLLVANCAQAQPPSVQETLRELCPQAENGSKRSIENLAHFFEELLDLDTSLFDTATGIAEDVSLYAPEGPQTLRPTFGLLHQDDTKPIEGAGTPASNAAAKYVALIWDVTAAEDGTCLEEALGLSLDKPETITGDWSYPPAAKFDRLLRHCRVPVGIITNREVIRLVYAPHGESSGHITFRIEDMVTVGGRPILDAMIMLLNANQWFGVSDENALPSLMKRSREHQGSVTEDLAEQVFSGLEALLQGFQQAAERDGSDLLQQALEQDDDHLYRGLLTVMLRLVFILYAEDRSLLPVEHPLYAKRMSLLGLFERLQRDHGNFPDSMNNRFGAWGHIVSLCRAIYLGVDHGDFHIPPRHGDLFDPHRFKFLEGWTGESAPVITQKARSEVQVPTVDDGTVFNLLRSLLIFQGQRLSYRTLDVEQIGSVYEALMGYHVNACESQAVAIKVSNKKGAPKYWLEPKALQAVASAQRLKWLQNDCGFDKGTATKIKKAVDGYEKAKPEERGALVEALVPLAAGKKDKSVWTLANPGQYILQPSAERRRSGSHYTPRSLTSPIVQKTLQPLLRCLGNTPTAEQILELKLCDPAMGSGAFLVECCRQLADEVVSAWGREKQVEEIATLCPEGDVVAHARRLVAQRCLYGVDKNVMAVQLAKLSLWLFTLARELPFTFLDHSLRYGDSLVGLNFEQIKAFHWRPEKQLSFLEKEINKALDEVVAIRQEIHALAENVTPEGQKLKAQRLFDANDATEKVRKIADLCVGAFFAYGKNKPRLEERQQREDIVRAWLSGDEGSESSINRWVNEIRSCQVPFHWWIEFPEVFYFERPDPLSGGEVNGAAYVDGFVGNPPFVGGRKISENFGTPYSEWISSQNSGSMNADLSAYFYRRSAELLGENGTLGLIATNTIGQGDTRLTGLSSLISSQWEIYDAINSMPWPGVAAVTVSIVHAVHGEPAQYISRVLDGKAVKAINSYLRPRPEREDPKVLVANSAYSYQGHIILGSGFTMSIEERGSICPPKSRNRECTFPYIGGSEVNSSPTQEFERYVIDFGVMDYESAEEWPELLNRVRLLVKPNRDKQKRKPLREKWWQFAENRPALREALSTIERCLVISRVTTHLMFSFQPTDRVFSEALYVIPIDTFTSFSVLQSRIHEPWAWLLSSTMKSDLRYSASDCFSTFPFPRSEPQAAIETLEAAGLELYEVRALYMVESAQGLTKTYNALKDPDCDDKGILELRRLHESMDRAVLNAYGWTDIEVPPYCPMNSGEEAAVEAFKDEVIDRLYVLNAKRAAEEERLSLTKAPAKKRATKKTVEKKQAEPSPTLDLF